MIHIPVNGIIWTDAILIHVLKLPHMYYLSAQPDELYFKWQLEVLVYNFHQLNIPADKIHILIFYKPDAGVNPIFEELTREMGDKARFFFYEDNRVKNIYIPSARPHVIKKHFAAHPYLENENIFYHDADIIFRELPDFDRLCYGNTWYVSNARSYIGAEFINSVCELIFHEMCEVLKIPAAEILINDKNSGGAQYLLKKTNYQFWDKIEHDSEKLYTYLSDNRERYSLIAAKDTGRDIKTYQGIQEWCADMWAVLWNAQHLKYDVKIDKDLDFCWPLEPVENWYATKILHNTGITGTDDPRYFRKTEHVKSVPYDRNYDHVLKTKCTVKYVDAIKAYVNSRRKDLSDVTFLIPCRIDSRERLENLEIIIHFLTKHLKTNIIVLEADSSSKIPQGMLPDTAKRIFVHDENKLFHHTKYNNQMIKVAETPYIAIYDADIIIDPEQLVECVNLLRNDTVAIAYPYNGHFLNMDNPEQKEYFKTSMDILILKRFSGLEHAKSFGGTVMLNKEIYIKCGMDNENFKKWGPEDMERVKRMEILGYRYSRVEGPLYHLNHPRLHNSTYISGEDSAESIGQYIEICNMSKSLLEKNISTWTWANS